MIDSVSRLGRRLRLLLRRSDVERSMDAELRHHVDSDIAERIANGCQPDEARRAALAAFGNVEAVKELGRDARGLRPLEDLAFDVRYGIRHLTRHPAFTLPALLTLGVGVAAATAIFSLVYGILLRPLPYAEPDDLVVLWEHNIPRHRDQNVVALDNFDAWRDRAQSFASMGAIIPTSVTLEREPLAERLAGADVTAGFFTLLGVRPELGRDFLAADGDGAVILSHDLWRRAYGSDPAIVGRSVTLSARAYSVVGVMPAAFEPLRIGWLGDQELWFSFDNSPQRRSWGRAFIVLARLRTGVDLSQARAEMTTIAAQRAREVPANAEWSANVVPLHAQITGDAAPSLYVLMAAVALMLAAAIANVAMLSLSLLGRRQQELSLRRALGATDRRLLRQLFVQTSLLGVAGVVLGLAGAFPAFEALAAFLPASTPRVGTIAVDAPVLLGAACGGGAVTLICAILAAVRGRRLSAATPLSAITVGSRRASGTGGRALVAVELAFAVALSVLAVLMIRSLSSLQQVDLGFQQRDVLVARLALPSLRYDTSARQRAFFDDVMQRVRSVPGVQAAGSISLRPLGGLGPATVVRDAGRPPAPAGQDPVADVRLVDAEFFSTLSMQFEAGTTFDSLDATRHPPRAVITSSLAKQLWPGRDPIGRSLALNMYDGATPSVAGVVNDAQLVAVRAPSRPAVFLPAARFAGTTRDFVIRGDREHESLLGALRAAVAAVDPSVPVYAVNTMTSLAEEQLSSDRLTMFLLVCFAAAALLLAAMGVFGVFASDVSRRKKEIGIRLVLGATDHGIVAVLVRSTLTPALLGVGAGCGLAWVVGRSMRSMLFGVTPNDVLSFSVAASVAMCVAAFGTLLPAWQTLRSSPLNALRED